MKYQIKRICSEITAAHVERALTELPKDLDEMYTEILATIRTRHDSARRSVVAEEALKWILFVARPLMPAELLDALAIAFADSITLPVVFDICQNLVVLDERLGVLRFAHFSVQEFLLRRFDGKDGHAGVADGCLRSLMKPGSSSPLRSEYAAIHWPAHVRQAGAAPGTVSLCVQFLAASNAYSAWVKGTSIYHLQPIRGALLSPLLVAAYFQLEQVFEELLLLVHDLNAANQKGYTALHLVAANGNEHILRLLLDRLEDVDIDRKNDLCGRTSLSYAAQEGHQKVVGMLLEHPTVDVNSTDHTGCSSLSWASGKGQDHVVQMLLEQDTIDVNLANGKADPPLCAAAREGHEGVVRLLLAHPATLLEATGRYAETAVSFAASQGHDGVLRMLLERGANAGGSGQPFMSPLALAAERGHEKVVAILIQRHDVDVNSPDINHRTPLSGAAGNGQAEVVKLLLESPRRVAVNSRDINNRTALSWAADNGVARVVQLLLGQLPKQSVDVNSKDSEYGRSALHWATESGNGAVVELLLGVDGLDVDSTDKHDRTPLSKAAQNGYEEVAQMLVTRADVQVDRADVRYRQTPLGWAAEYGHGGILQMLLATGRVAVDHRDCDNRTPLCWAATNGFDKVVRLLLHHGADVNSADEADRTPLYWAALYGHGGVVNTLLGNKGVDVNRPDNQYRRSPLSTAAEHGHDEVVESLLTVDGVDVDSLDGTHRTPLSYAAETARSDIVKMLLAKAGVDVNSRDSNYGKSPLFWAAENGYREVVELLLGDGRVDIDSADNTGVSPVSKAAENGYEEVVELLCERGAVMV